MAQAEQDFVALELGENVHLEEVVEGAFAVGGGFERRRRGADHDNPSRLLQHTPQAPLLRLEAGEDDVEVVEQEEGSSLLLLHPGFEQPQGPAAFVVVVLYVERRHVAVETLGVVSPSCRLEPVSKSIEAVGPENVEVVNVVLLLAEAERQEHRGERRLGADAQRDTAQQAGLSHAALADDEAVLREAAGLDLSQTGENLGGEVLPDDETRQKGLILQPVRIVEREVERPTHAPGSPQVAARRSAATSRVAGSCGTGSGNDPEPRSGSRRPPRCPRGLAGRLPPAAHSLPGSASGGASRSLLRPSRGRPRRGS